MPLSFDPSPFREPRGFIKLLEWIFAIFAFATAVNFSSETGFVLPCQDNVTSFTVKTTVEYPFQLDLAEPVVVPANCSTPPKALNISNFSITFFGNAASDARYFVCTGVLSLLVASVAIGVYGLAGGAYEGGSGRLPAVDLLVTLLLAIFWISSLAAFGSGLTSLKGATDPNTIWRVNALDHGHQRGLPPPTSLITPGYSPLVISILFGVINFVLWTGNLWFLYKETKWFDSILNKNQGVASAS